MILIIDTSDDNIFLGLGDSNNLVCGKKIKAKFAQEEKLLTELNSLLKLKKINKKSLVGILVVKGPGGFSGLRVGVAVANSLSWSWRVPVLGFAKSEFENYEGLLKIGSKKISHFDNKFISPVYGREPNVNKNKKRR